MSVKRTGKLVSISNQVIVERGFGKGSSDHEAEISLNKSSVRPPVPRCLIKFIGRWGAGVGAPHPQRKILGMFALLKKVRATVPEFCRGWGSAVAGPHLPRAC